MANQLPELQSQQRTSSLPLPDPLAFGESPFLLKKKKKTVETPKCPATPFRTPPISRLFHEKHAQTEPRISQMRVSTASFEFLSKLGEGSFGQVWKVKHKRDGMLYALKRSKRPIWNTYERDRQLKEIENIHCLGFHRNIVKIEDAWTEGGHLYILTELCSGGNLKDYLLLHGDQLHEENILRIFVDVLLGVNLMHSKGVTHLDIKPENLLLSDEHAVKVADFGLAFCANNTSDRNEGDSVYMAPELLNDIFTPAADVFSLGMTLFEMATDVELPTQGTHWHNLREGRVLFPPDYKHSPELRSIIIGMLSPDPSLRPTTQDLLRHHLLQSIICTLHFEEQHMVSRQLRFSDSMGLPPLPKPPT